MDEEEYDEQHQRFAIAHELGHYFMHLDYCMDKENPVFLQTKDDEHGIEAEACKFAAMLLMDKDKFIEAYKSIKEVKKKRTMDVIRELSQRFVSPQSAVKRRIIELGISDA